MIKTRVFNNLRLINRFEKQFGFTEFDLLLPKHCKNMIKFGVLIDEDPVKEYLRQLSGKMPFEISGFFQLKRNSELYSTPLLAGKEFISYDELIEKSDAILFLSGNHPDSEKVNRAIKRFKHVFLSKALNIEDQRYFEMVELAREANVLVCTGNPLLYNSAFLSLCNEITHPVHVEIRRKNKPEFKSDTNIIRELITDIEFLLSIIKANPKKIVPGGIQETRNIPTMINTRIEFDNGASASLIYDFLHDEEKHLAHIYQRENHLYLDFIDLKTKIFQLEKNNNINDSQTYDKPFMRTHRSTHEANSSFITEIMAFYSSLSNKMEPKVSFEESLIALKLANKVMNRVLISKDQFA